MNIELSNLKKHFFYKNNIINNKKKYKTKIVEYCFYAINEANISNKIKKIPYYSNYYSILEDYDTINIRNIDDKINKNVQLLDKNKKYLLFTYKNHINSLTEELTYFNDYLFKFKNSKILIFSLISSFSCLLDSLIQIEDNNICFFQLSSENILFDEEIREKPLLTNFQLSLQISKLNEEYIANIIKKTQDYSLKPLEVHILFYLIENNIKTISYSIIEEIVEFFIENLSILAFFSQNYKDTYKSQCIDCLKKYINKSKNEIIADILKQYKKWDVYSVSVLYLHIFANISQVFSLKQTFISKFSIELMKGCHPDPLKRINLCELKYIFNNLLDLQKDWSFVNTLDNRKIVKLLEVLKK
jgi:hypothetical protein